MATKLEDLMDEHRRLSHAMQAGVAMEENWKDASLTPKHLRVGVNVALSDAGGLVALLVKKGLFTEEEYFEAIVETMRTEVKNYEERDRHAPR